jgi:hypothetical protein
MGDWWFYIYIFEDGYNRVKKEINIKIFIKFKNQEYMEIKQ